MHRSFWWIFFRLLKCSPGPVLAILLNMATECLMRKLIVISFLTLDGVMQSPGDKVEDTEGGFKYGGWQVPYLKDVDDAMSEDLGQAGALLLGRKTYDIFAAYWPTLGKNDEQYGAFMNNITKYVASKTMPSRSGKIRFC